ncbi:lytic transglycosylase domain-containing protein [Occultella kanbiaonis]|uniref:lytic transglycosylase domain-containing protein n=1 Tax=Occultella kanbiaonis TaxID=2675754 RepID=UPI001F36E93D|nr:lytic transglycosylase domain-containing protein [Occultella kanbiaonis]
MDRTARPRHASARWGSALTTAGALSAVAAMGLASSVAPAAAQPHSEEQPQRSPGHLPSHLLGKNDGRATRITTESAGAGLSPTLRSVAPAPRAAGDSLYTVRAGDTVGHLALRFDVPVSAIVSANGLDSRAIIRIGQTLTIPGASTGSSNSAPSGPAPAPATSGGSSYTVTSGDTVSRIAARHGTTVSAIVSANGLDSRALIRIGQTLTIPGGSGGTVSSSPASPAAAPTQAAPAPSGGSSHTVRSGETVSGIASRYGTTASAIVSANGLDSRALIRIGQTLTIPGSTQLVPNTFLHYTYSDDVNAAANANAATLLGVSVPSRAAMQEMIRATAVSMGVDPALALAVAQQESGFNMRAVSPANAVGVMQVIPSSGEWASDLVGRRLNLLDPQDNVTAGVAILRALVRTAPDMQSAIGGYYQGLGSVNRNGLYDDTRRYVANVQTLMARY